LSVLTGLRVGREWAAGSRFVWKRYGRKHFRAKEGAILPICCSPSAILCGAYHSRSRVASGAMFYLVGAVPAIFWVVYSIDSQQNLEVGSKFEVSEASEGRCEAQGDRVDYVHAGSKNIRSAASPRHIVASAYLHLLHSAWGATMWITVA